MNQKDICEEYQDAVVVSRLDFLVMLYLYMFLDYKMFIPDFFQALDQNKKAFKLEMGEFLPYLVDAIDESIGKSIIQNLLDYMFDEVAHVSRGTKMLIKEEVVYSALCAEVNNSELLDYKAFYTEKGNIPPLQIETWKWNYIFNFEQPQRDFIKLLRAILVHLEDDSTTLRGKKITKLIMFMWKYYQKFFLIEFYLSFIPLFC